MSTFPQPFTSSVSYWQDSNRGPTSLWNYNDKADMPTDPVDYCIVGAGMTGSSLAYQLTRAGAVGEGKKIVVLEAKDVASGATGRNGGHLAPASSHSYPALITPLADGGAGVSEAEACKIIDDEHENFRFVREIIEREGWEADVGLWTGKIVHVYGSEAEKAGVKKARDMWIAARKRLGQSTEEKTEYIDDPEEARKITRCPAAVGAYLKPAGSVNPHKLATKLLRSAIESTTSDCSFYSWAPVSSVKEGTGPDEADLWLVESARGTILARQVILCSNAHTGHLFPEGSLIKKHITPLRGHASHIVPPSTFKPLEMTYGWSGPYLVSPASNSPPRPGPEGFVMGIGWGVSVSLGLGKPEDFMHQVDDSVVLPGVKEYLAGFSKKAFAWGDEKEGEEGLVKIWTGIMGYSKDLLPLIGPVPERPGLWVAAAFHGHGMSRILSCTHSLALQLASPSYTWDARLPSSFEITHERLNRCSKLGALPRSLDARFTKDPLGGMLKKAPEKEKEVDGEELPTTKDITVLTKGVGKLGLSDGSME